MISAEELPPNLSLFLAIIATFKEQDKHNEDFQKPYLKRSILRGCEKINWYFNSLLYHLFFALRFMSFFVYPIENSHRHNDLFQRLFDRGMTKNGVKMRC